MKLSSIFSLPGITVIALISCSNVSTSNRNAQQTVKANEVAAIDSNTQVIYFAGGCFWGTEHFFKQIKGVSATEVGYANGRTKKPTYRDVVNNNTGYAETVKVSYRPDKLDLRLLIELYYKTIDPTSVNRQGNDYGTQYRTGIYYTQEDQLPVIKAVTAEVQEKYSNPLAVEITLLKSYYTAEDYHQDYLENNPGGYCHINRTLFEEAKKANQKN